MTTGRVSDVELMRGDRRASLRASLLSRSRASASSLGLDDEIPAFDDQVGGWLCMCVCAEGWPQQSSVRTLEWLDVGAVTKLCLSWLCVVWQDLKGAGQLEEYGNGTGKERVPLSLDDFEDAGGLVSFDSSQLLPSQEGLGEEEGDGGDAAARRRGGEEFRLSLLSGGDVEPQGQEDGGR